MGSILRASVAIKGVRSILWHHFGPDSIPLPGQERERTGVAGNDPEEWKRTVLMTADRQLFLKPNYIFGMCRDAARYTKKNRGSIQSDVAATLLIADERILFHREGQPLVVPENPSIDGECPVYIDVCSVKNPTTKARNVRYRVAASPGWETGFTLLFDKTLVNREQMRAVLEDASKLVGLADGRGIGYGRFVVEKYEVEDA